MSKESDLHGRTKPVVLKANILFEDDYFKTIADATTINYCDILVDLMYEAWINDPEGKPFEEFSNICQENVNKYLITLKPILKPGAFYRRLLSSNDEQVVLVPDRIDATESDIPEIVLIFLNQLYLSKELYNQLILQGYITEFNENTSVYSYRDQYNRRN